MIVHSSYLVLLFHTYVFYRINTPIFRENKITSLCLDRDIISMITLISLIIPFINIRFNLNRVILWYYFGFNICIYMTYLSLARLNIIIMIAVLVVSSGINNNIYSYSYVLLFLVTINIPILFII